MLVFAPPAGKESAQSQIIFLLLSLPFSPRFASDLLDRREEILEDRARGEVDSGGDARARNQAQRPASALEAAANLAHQRAAGRILNRLAGRIARLAFFASVGVRSNRAVSGPGSE